MSEQQIEVQNNKTAPSPKEVIAYLVEKFPACFFDGTNGEVKPLKKGIFQDLATALEGDEKVSKTTLRHTLRVYTRSWRYLTACQENAERVGLNGEACEVITAEEAAHAAEALAESKAIYQAKMAEKRKEERKEQRKAYFKQKAKEERANKRSDKPKKAPAAAATAESLAALADKFGKK
ncbi:RNA chaperone ProQ [Haemophilus paracuniculus]|uniref:RNA chaperone ProQ n=1 Tax=Haemophilus paracuniculus TaxID=734 RepID=A0A1T0ATC7_9PAST|nr:RNA chaperone ProQ [Haemophilus paracuniculus]OOR99811.1 RNA chaperone ProQ [Haemophilus paracuniculus]